MRRFTKKKTISMAAGAMVLLVGAGVAYAYWTGSGTGTGTAPTGTTAGITINQTGTLTPMFPGDSAQTLSGDFTNPTAGPVHVNSVTVSIASVVDTNGAAITGCTAADYTLAATTMTVNQDIAAGTTGGTWTGATIQFHNTTANQDACKDAVVNLAYTSA